MRLISSFISLLILALSGCSTIHAPDVNYTTKTESTIKSNGQQLELKKKALESLTAIRKKELEMKNALDIEKLKLAHEDQGSKKIAVKPDISHCNEYRDEYPERFTSCLEDKINEISTGDGRQYGNTPSIIVSGNHNIVNIGSPGAEINQNGRGKQDKEGNVASAIIKLIEKDSFTPLPEQPVQKHPVAQAIDATKGLAKELAYPVLYGVLGWKGFGTLEKGIEKESSWNITQQSNNPVTMTTYPQAVAE